MVGENPVARGTSTTLRARITGGRLAGILARLVSVLLLGAVVGVIEPVFVSSENILNMLRQGSVIGLVALGETAVILTGGIDLSVGATLALSAIVSGWLLQSGYSPAIAVGGALLVSLIIGLANGILVTVVRLPSFVATYGMHWIAFGLSIILLQGQIITSFPGEFRFLGAGSLLGLPVPVWVAAVMALFVAGMLYGTVFGRAVYAIGANPTVAILSGIPIRRTLIATYVLSALMAGIGAVVVAGRVNGVEPNLWEPYLLPVVAAVVIGGTSLFGGEGTIEGTLVGALLLAMISTAMVILGTPTAIQPIVVGILMVTVVFLDQYSRSRVA